jgi:hypothetical protein
MDSPVDWNKVRVREIKPNRRRRKKQEAFVILPFAWAASAATATNTSGALVWIWLVWQARMTGRRAVAMSNEALIPYGISHKIKARVLRRLEKAGLITVQRRVGKAPLVQLRVPGPIG